jgi:hypothetical protein
VRSNIACHRQFVSIFTPCEPRGTVAIPHLCTIPSAQFDLPTYDCLERVCARAPVTPNQYCPAIIRVCTRHDISLGVRHMWGLCECSIDVADLRIIRSRFDRGHGQCSVLLGVVRMVLLRCGICATCSALRLLLYTGRATCGIGRGRAKTTGCCCGGGGEGGRRRLREEYSPERG